MIPMLMREEHRVNRLRSNPNARQPAEYLLSAQSRIDQQPRMAGRDVGGVPGAAAGEDADADDGWGSF